MEAYLRRSRTFSGMESIAEFEKAAKRRVSKTAWKAQFGVATGRSNEAAFQGVALRPRVMVDVSDRKLVTTVLGEQISLPVMVCPAGGLTRFNPQGDLAVARAAAAAGTLMTVAMPSGFSLEEIAQATTGPLWDQIIVLKDKAITELLVRRAEKAGYKGLVITVDFAGHGGRWHWSGLTEAAGYVGEQIWPNFAGIPNAPSIDRWDSALSLTFTWSDLKWLRSITSMPLILKGIQTADDATLCVRNGVDAIWISNHGGEGLPGAPASITVLPEVIEAVGNQVEVYLDSGVRTGTDVLKALALGARAVCIGRPMAWGLLVAGEAGVRDVLEILREELTMAMGLCGVTDVLHVDRSLVRVLRES